MSVQLSIDLFGGVVILSIVTDGKENSLGISKEFGTGLIVMASLSFPLTLLQNGGNNLGNIDRCVSRNEKAVIAPYTQSKQKYCINCADEAKRFHSSLYGLFVTPQHLCL